MTKEKIIKVDTRFKFYFDEFDKKFNHPASNYYFKLDDLSINNLITLKWILWGYDFLENIKKELDGLQNYDLNQIITKNIQKLDNIEKKKKIILIDNTEIENIGCLIPYIEDTYLAKPQNILFDVNTKIHLKLKLNLDEFLILNHLLYPHYYSKSTKIE